MIKVYFALCIYLIVLVMLVLISGCAETPDYPSKLVRPSSMLMISPEPLPEIVPGDDVVVHALKVRRLYGKETSKLKRLQRWVRTVTK